MPTSAFHRVSLCAILAGSLLTAAACSSNSTPHAGGPNGTSGTHAAPAGNPDKGPKPPVYTATVPTISNGTNKLVIDHVAVTFPSTVTDAAWSPDGTRLAYVDANGNIAIARPDGSAVLVLTAAKPGVTRADPAFEDGGGEIVFSERGTDGVWRLMSVAADGSDGAISGSPSEALMDSIGDGTADTSASATYNPAIVNNFGPLSTLAYQHQGANGPEIWILDRNQRGPQGRKARDGAQPAVSVDGSKLAFVGSDGQLYTEALPITSSSVAIQVTFGARGLAHPVWSPDGSRLAFGTASDIESVSATLAPGATANPVRVESPTPGIPSYEPMVPTRVLRFASGDPVATSIAQTKAYYATAPSDGVPEMTDGIPYASTVTLVSTQDPAAVTVAGLAVYRNTVLFTSPNAVSPATLAELTRLLGPAHPASRTAPAVRIVGDTSVVSAAVESAVTALGYQVTRVPDADPIAEAAALNGKTLGNLYSGPVFLVSATDTPAIMALVAAQHGSQILFTNDVTMPAVDQPILNGLTLTGQYPAKVIAVGAQAQAALASSWPGKPSGLSGTPLGGSDANANSVLIARQYSDGPTEVALAASGVWQDELLAATNGPGMPLLVVDPQTLSTQAIAYLENSAASVSTVVLFGDSATLTDGIAKLAAAALGAPAGSTTTLNPTKLLHL